MPLQDHFHPPLSLRRPWTSFHNSWATSMSADVNRQLPDGYFAVANVQFGIEIDVTTIEKRKKFETGGYREEWRPPATVMTVPLGFITDVVEVQVFGGVDGPRLAGAIELVSPSNKDRPAEREAFVAKCASYLHQGVGLVIVDVVTTRRANLHEALLVSLGSSADRAAAAANLYATAYHPVQHGIETSLDIWQEALALSEPLPTLSLCLRGGPCLRIYLESTYERTRQEQRIGINGV